MEDNPGYMHWLERMWDADRLVHYRRVEREEKRVEEVLGIFEELEEISGRPIEFPVFPASYKMPLR